MANPQGIDQGRERGGSAKGGRRMTVAIVGPFQSGKTTLLEALLARTGAISRAGQVAGGSSVGDASAEARAHQMSIEPNVATAQYLADHFTFIDCPGSVEFLHDMRTVLPLCDAAVVVCEADSRKIPALQVILHELEDLGIPRFLFLNKIDTATARVRETLALLQPASRTPLLLRQIPIWKNGVAEGFVDLASERAYIYRDQAESKRTDVPNEEMSREKEARFTMLERLADYDDALMETLLSDAEPPRDQVYKDLAQELAAGHVAPVFIGSAGRGNGVTRLLKALRHEIPGLDATRARLGLTPSDQPLAQVMRTIHTAHGGKLSVARVLAGVFQDGETVAISGGGEERITGINRMVGQSLVRISEARAGDCVAFGRLDGVATGMAIGMARGRPQPAFHIARPEPVMALVLHADDRKDDVKLSAALHKLEDEDPALRVAQAVEGGEMTLSGQGEMHLRVAMARIRQRFGLAVSEGRAPVAYRETIRDAVSARGRHKKQSGGHGQFGDCMVTVRPLERGEGIQFKETVTGGAVPRQYIPAVEEGARAALKRGPLGFAVVDVEVTLTDGSYHSVDSSDMAFQIAGRIAIDEALPKARPVLLEPVLAVDLAVPTDAIAKATQLVSSRRGQILGFGPRPGWSGWEVVQALVPEGEMDGLIIELRSATAGVGSFTQRFDHLAEVNGKLMDHVVTERKRQLAA
ncbi:MAG: elongation factor G [Beijerinckiaceae bacterium]